MFEESKEEFIESEKALRTTKANKKVVKEMLERKRKKHDYADRLKYMRLLETGRSFKSIHKEYGIDSVQLRVLWEKYKIFGKAGLKKCANIKADFALKKKIVLDIEENHLTLHAASLKYGASYQRIYVWLRQYRENGS